MSKAQIVKVVLVALLVLVPGGVVAQEDDVREREHEASEEAYKKAVESLPPKPGPEMSSEARVVGDPDHPPEPVPGSFGPDHPDYSEHVYSAEAQWKIWGAGPDAKHMNPMSTPPVVVGRRLYDRGAYKTRATPFGKKNETAGAFFAYGDLRVAAAYNDNGVPGTDDKGNVETSQTLVAVRLNLDLDLQLTATERIHAFVRPFDDGSRFTRYELDGKKTIPGDDFYDELDFEFDTLFFEGDIGAMASGWSDERKKYDLPIAFGLTPMITQNGVWLEDAFVGAAIAITAKNSPKAKISNYDFTFFFGVDRINSDAVRDQNDAKMIGFASFMDFGEGYLEYGYGFVHEDVDDFSYHNFTVAWSKRYWGRLSNSIRFIGNFGQDPIPGRRKTADGYLLLIENSWIGSKPSTFIPYFNFWYGVDTPQSLARDPGSGGVLRNTGIIFETDGITGYPTLDARGHDSFGGSFGINNLFGLNKQFVVEATYLDRHGDLGRFLGSEYGIAVRFQKPLNNRWIFRADALNGWRDPPLQDITAARVEMRWKM